LFKQVPLIPKKSSWSAGQCFGKGAGSIWL